MPRISKEEYEKLMSPKAPEVPKAPAKKIDRGPTKEQIIKRSGHAPDMGETDKPRFLFACPEYTVITGTEAKYHWVPKWFELQPDGGYRPVYGRAVSSFSEALAKTLHKLEMWSGFAHAPDPRK